MKVYILFTFFALALANTSLQYRAQAELVQIVPFGADSLHVRISPSGTVVTPAVQALLPNPPSFETKVSVTPTSIQNGNLRADIISEGVIKFTRVSDNVTLITTSKYSFAENEDKLYSAVLSYTTSTTERIYGLGEHRTGKVQNKPIFLDFQRSQVYTQSHGSDISIPFYQSSEGYGFLWNLPSFGYLDMSQTGTTWVSNSTQQLDFWVTTTSEQPSATPYADILSHYVDATGHPPVLPIHASGFWQCKDRYRNQSEVLDIMSGYYQRLVPVGIFVIDWQHWIHVGDFSFNPLCWPNPSAMVSSIIEHGTHVMVSVWPVIDGNSVNFKPMEAAGYLVHDKSGKAQPFHSGQYLYDPYNSNAREYVWAQIKKGYYDNGIKYYWLDACEPERVDPDQSGQYYYALGRDLQVGMAYPFMHQQTVYNGMKSLNEPDVLMLSRSAWAGSQRWSTVVWSGDITSTFDELALQVKIVQNMGMSGIYWWTTDIGGYWGANINDPVFQELIVRWFQFGAFCPIFRLHGHRQPEEQPTECGGGGNRNEIWEWGQTAETVITKVILLRETLRGYVMDLMRAAADHGAPVSRPMCYEFPRDPMACTAEDQFMFGSDWLVAPVVQYKATSRSVYFPSLPNNQTWTHYYTNQDYKPGRTTVPTTINDFPLFYRRYVTSSEQ